MLSASRLTGTLSKISLISAHGPWTRCVGYEHLLGPPLGLAGKPQPLWGGASKINGARFTPPGSFDSIYIASDPITSLTEVWAVIMLPNGPVPAISAPQVVVSIEGIIHNLLDVTNAKCLQSLNTTIQEVTGPYATSQMPPTQVLGQAAYDSGRITGIKYSSARNPGGLNIVLFPDRIPLSSGMYLAVHDPHGRLNQRIGTP
jgi:RES domain-containing protein